MPPLTPLVWGLLTLATGTMSLSYDFDDSSVNKTFYALNGKPVRLQFDLPSGGKAPNSFGWMVTLRNRTNFIISSINNPLSKFLIMTSQAYSTVLEIKTFDAFLFAGSQLLVFSLFQDGIVFTPAKGPVVTLLGGHQPNFTIVEDRNYSTGKITLTARLFAGLPLPDMTVNGTVLFPIRVEGSNYNYVQVVGIERVQSTVYNFVATNEVGNLSLTYNLLALGLGGNDTVNCRSASSDPIILSCSYETFPRASAVLICLTITKKAFKTLQQQAANNVVDSGLFQVAETFTTETSYANCSADHVCVLQVNNSITSTNYTNVPVALICPTASPSVTSTAFSLTPSFKKCTWFLSLSDEGVASWTEDGCFLGPQTASLLLVYNTSSEKYQVKLDRSTTKYQFRGLVPGREYEIKLQAVRQDQIIELAVDRFKAKSKTEDCQTNDTGLVIAVSTVSVLLAVAAAFIVFLYCSGKRNGKEAKEDTDVEMHASPVYEDRASTVRKKADLPNEPNVEVYASISESA